MKPGDDVIIEFEGEEHLGCIERIERGWIRAAMQTDPEFDYGSGTDRLAPHQTVCVPEARVRVV